MRAASPVSWNAWQRHPPKSSSRRSQVRHGSGIQSVPRNAVITGDSAQIRSSGSSRTLARGNGRDWAAGQGRTSPFGVTVSCRDAQPPMQGFG